MRVSIAVESDWNRTKMGRSTLNDAMDEFAHTARVRRCHHVQIPDVDFYPETRTLVFSCDIPFGGNDNCGEWKFVHYLDMVRAAFLPCIAKTR